MAKKYEFQPDKPYSSWLNKLQLTKLQKKQALKWALYSALLVLLSVVQDVILCRLRIFGGTTDLVPCGIFLICALEGSHNGSLFALLASIGYLSSGSAPGPQVLVLITVLGALTAAPQQAYLQPGLRGAMLCTLLAMVVYELAIFAFCLLLGLVTAGRVSAFLVSAVLSPLAVPALYLLARPITAIGGRSWKE